MKLKLIAIGNSRNSYEMKLFQLYVRRITFSFELTEVVVKKNISGTRRKIEESSLLLSRVTNGSVIVALDECGQQQTSQKFARQIQIWQDNGEREVAFLIGGASGLDNVILERAQLILSFGAQTWPHLLVRSLLAEQIYRAQTIILGHPYHRA